MEQPEKLAPAISVTGVDSERSKLTRACATTAGYQRLLKVVDDHAAATALHFMDMNFGRAHKSLAKPYPRTSAMAAGLADQIWTCQEIAALLD